MSKINISFCYDKNLWKQFCIAITSLLSVSKGKCSYDIYCVVSKDIDKEIQKQIKTIVSNIDKNSTITFFTDNNDFFNPKLNHAQGFYFRLQLPKHLKNVDKIIYSDIDVIFKKDLLDLYNIDMKNNLLYGIHDGMNLTKSWKKYITRTDSQYLVKQGTYINSGIMLINIKAFQDENLYPKFIKMVGARLKHKDQDMLNYICQNRIGNLELKYNFTPKSSRKYKRMIQENLITENELKEAKKNPVVLHFMNSNPWKTIKSNADIWWKYAKSTPFYEDMKNVFYKKASLLSKLRFWLMKK